MKILQLGKFYPVLGGVEKVMFDLTVGTLGDGAFGDGTLGDGAFGGGAFGGGGGVRHDVRGKRREGDGGHPA